MTTQPCRGLFLPILQRQSIQLESVWPFVEVFWLPTAQNTIFEAALAETSPLPVIEGTSPSMPGRPAALASARLEFLRNTVRKA
jgi:hypothetical protein